MNAGRDQAAGPSTPGGGFGSFDRPAGPMPPQQRAPSTSSPVAQTSSTFGNEFGGLARSSSLRSVHAGQSPQSGFAFGGMREMSTPKTVRWHDAPDPPPHQQQQPLPAHLPLQPSQPHLSFGMQSQQQQQQQQTPAPQRTLSFSSPLTTQQLQRTSPHQTLQSQFSSSLAAPDASQALNTTSSPPSALQQTKSAFSRSVVQETVTSKASPPARAVEAAAGAQTKRIEGDAPVVIASRPAIAARIKWNSLALLFSWVAPHFGPAGRAYWLMLDAAYSIFGGTADVYLATVISWLHKASILVLLINLIEAVILLNVTPTNTEKSAKAGTTQRKPSLAFPPNRSAPSSSPQMSASPSQVSKRNTPRHYAQGSPLRESIFRASASAQGLGEERRLPSHAPRFDRSHKSSSSASPLAAFLARKQDRLASGGDVGDISWDGDAGAYADTHKVELLLSPSPTTPADLSTDSIEVDRALRAFSAGYERELSESRSLGTETQKGGIAV